MSHVIVGVFDNQADAEDAVDALDGMSGLEPGTIHVITRREVERSDGVLSSLARAFRGGRDELSSELQRLGVGSEEADFYSEEVGDEGVVVAVEVDDDTAGPVRARMREAQATLYQD